MIQLTLVSAGDLPSSIDPPDVWLDFPRMADNVQIRRMGV